jgi:hypothetical protein
MSEIQREISKIAYDKWNKGITVTFSALRKTLLSMRLKPGTTDRALGQQIKAAYNHSIEEKNQGIADCIANCFTDENGELFWKR